MEKSEATKMNAKIRNLKNGQVGLYLNLNEFELEDFCLQEGLQPEGIFRIQIKEVKK